MRQLWKALGVRNRAGLLAECCCAPLRACSLPQAAPRAPSSEEVETMLQLQHCSKLSPPQLLAIFLGQLSKYLYTLLL